MGLDLSFFVEIRQYDGSWQWRGNYDPEDGCALHDEFFIPRDYGFYALLGYQSSRMNYEANEALANRQLPEDLSATLLQVLQERWGDPIEEQASFSWVTFQEILDLTPLIPVYLNKLYESLVAHIREIGEEPEDIRLILEYA